MDLSVRFSIRRVMNPLATALQICLCGFSADRNGVSHAPGHCNSRRNSPSIGSSLVDKSDRDAIAISPKPTFVRCDKNVTITDENVSCTGDKKRVRLRPGGGRPLNTSLVGRFPSA